MKFTVSRYKRMGIVDKLKKFFKRGGVEGKEFLGFVDGRCIFRLSGVGEGCQLRITSGKVVLTATFSRGIEEILEIGRESMLWQMEMDGSLHVIGEEEEWEKLWKCADQ